MQNAGTNSGQKGEAYIYIYIFTQKMGNTWSEKQSLTTSDGIAADHFGTSVSISGVLVIGGFS